MIYLLIGVLIIAVAMFVVMSWAVSRKHSLTENAVATIQNKWQEIEDMKNSEDEHSWVRAIMEADKLVDYALKQKRIAGETMGERLKNSSALFSDVQYVWDAHKLRNRLAHEMDTNLTRNQMEEALAKFRKALRELKGL